MRACSTTSANRSTRPVTASACGFKRLPWEIHNQVPEGIVCHNFPGPLGQIVINGVQNAVTHAFAGRSCGQVTISASLNAGMVTLTIADDGNGMDGPTLGRVFEPFFTTKLGRGGSGLGLAICHRIARTVLGGELIARSAPGNGSVFELRFASVAASEYGAENGQTMRFGQ